jgi:DNA modification methylase
MLPINKIYNMDCIEGLKQIEDEKRISNHHEQLKII